MPKLISITACAKALNSQGSIISSQGLGKYCKAHDLIRGRGQGRGQPALVNLEEVIAHRAENFTREVMTGEASGAKPSPAAPPNPTLATTAPLTAPANLDDARRLKKIQADKAQLDFEHEIGQLTAITEVDAGLAELFSAQRGASKSALSAWAERATAELGLPAERLRQIRTLGRDLFRDAEQAFYTEAVKIADKTRKNETATRARLERLAAIAHRLRALDAKKATATQV